jgi:hypothetical protein
MVSMKKILGETEHFLMTSEFEQVEITNKETGDIFAGGDHYGNPVAGAISPDERWYVSAGEGLVFFDFSGSQICAFRNAKRSASLEKFGFRSEDERNWLNSKHADDTFFVHSLKVESSNRIRILLDPWSEYASVWLLDITGKQLSKLREGPNLRDQAWQETVDF